MSYLIDRQAAIMGLIFSDCTRDLTCGQMAKILYVIQALPSAQPEIIRCKDCKHHSHDAGYGYDWCNRTSGVFRVKPEDFCSYAERREE